MMEGDGVETVALGGGRGNDERGSQGLKRDESLRQASAHKEVEDSEDGSDVGDVEASAVGHLQVQESSRYLQPRASVLNAADAVVLQAGAPDKVRALFRLQTKEVMPPSTPADAELSRIVRQAQERLDGWLRERLDGAAARRIHEMEKAMLQDQAEEAAARAAAAHEGYIIESPHPYPDNSNVWHKIEILGAKYLKIWFSAQTATEATHDYVTFHAEYDDTSRTFGDAKYSGPQSSNNFPREDDALYIPLSRVWVHFVSDGSTNDWGYKILFDDASDYTPPLSNEEIYAAGVRRQGAVEFESPHPYPDDANDIVKIEIPGADRIGIVFHEETTTEKRYDFVQFVADEQGAQELSERYSGGRSGSVKNFPGIGGKPAFEADCASLFYKFASDGSNNDWGFRFVAFPLFDFFRAMKERESTDSWATQHPYGADGEIHFNLVVPEAAAIKVAFHPRSQTESRYDYVKLFTDLQRTEVLYRPTDNADSFSGDRGKRNWPTLNDPITINGSRIYGIFNSDSETQSWGVEIVAWDADDSIPRDPFDPDAQRPSVVEEEAPPAPLLGGTPDAERQGGVEEQKGDLAHGSAWGRGYRKLLVSQKTDSPQRRKKERAIAANAMLHLGMEISLAYRTRYLRVPQERR
uniref:CUB domain-containing protein n=1 Tax=Phaeomonas parva TaxID=124430 RepID=A0A6U4FM67_9STRA|mmetsp:Transcript_26461/g.82615  ORF Transcript_26461/g.82615 Transcript_26461/m.82615 type:complete len:637 (-) Transcript_26461:591-2501(-)